MSASASKEITDKIMSEAEQESMAREAAELIAAKRNFSMRLQDFQRRSGATPEDIVLTFGMSKLQSLIITK
jgi:hypothetical protein